MNNQWWKLYAFIALACVVLFGMVSAGQSAMILWVIVVYAVLAIWVRDQYTHPHPHSHVPAHKPPVEEFFDEDRL